MVKERTIHELYNFSDGLMLLVSTIKHLIEHRSETVHFHFNPDAFKKERIWKEEESFTEKFYDTNDLKLHKNGCYYRERVYESGKQDLIIKYNATKTPIDKETYVISYSIFTNLEDFKNNYIGDLSGILDTIRDNKSNFVEASYECQRYRFNDHLYYDCIQWKNKENNFEHYEVATLEIDAFNLGESLNIMRRFYGYYSSKLFHYWHIEGKLNHDEPIEVKYLDLNAIIDKSKTEIGNITSIADQRAFLYSINSLILQSSLPSKDKLSIEDSIIVDIFINTHKYACAYTSKSNTIADIRKGVQEMYIYPKFEPQYKFGSKDFCNYELYCENEKCCNTPLSELADETFNNYVCLYLLK